MLYSIFPLKPFHMSTKFIPFVEVQLSRPMYDINNESFQRLFGALRLGRRQACKAVAALVLSLWPFSALGIKNVFAEPEGRAYGPLSLRREITMKLTPASFDGTVSLEKAIKQRRTIRSFKSDILTVAQLSQILWSAQGITEDKGFKRAAPSGGALYPADVYAVLGKNCVEGLDEGVYHYLSEGHLITRTGEGDRRGPLANASLQQMWMSKAPVSIVITAEYARICVKYGQRGIRYALMEAGHIGQNIFLQCRALGLEAGIVGAFDDKKVSEAIAIPANHEPLLIMPLGYGPQAGT